MTAMLGKAWHARQGYETCECGRATCRHRRRAERKRMRRIEAHELRVAMKKAGWR